MFEFGGHFIVASCFSCGSQLVGYSRIHRKSYTSSETVLGCGLRVYSMSSETQPQEQKASGAVIRLRGLPWEATPENIVEFFKDIKVKNGTEGVHFKMQRDGRASGEAFVELETSDDRDASLALNGQYIGKRYIEVYDSSYPMMEREIGPLFRGEQGCVIRLRGLPYRSTEEDIRLFFKDLQIESIVIQKTDNNRQTGEAFVVFLSPDDAELSLEKHKESIGSRYIEVFRSSYDEIVETVYDQPYNRRSGPYDRGGPRNYHSGSETRGYASKKGSGYERLYRGGGGGVGQNRQAEFSPNPSYGGYGGGGMPSFGGPGYGGGPMGPGGNFGFPPPGPGGPGGPPPQMAPQQGGIHGGPPGGHQVGYNPPGPSGPVGGSGPYGNGQGFHQPQNPSGPYRQDGGYPGSGSGFYGEGPGQGSGSEMVTYPPIRSTVGGYKGGSMLQVKLRGLPFTAKEEAVEKFLQPLQPTSIEILFDNYNRASGEALVTFGSQHEVDEALKKHKQYIGEFCPSVSQCNQVVEQ
jgi:heterogeneous nuclear ribonucleoprotein F/H